MKRVAILFVGFTLFALVFVTYADSNSKGHEKPLEVVLEEIRESQGIGENERIDCGKVTDKQLEELGEAVMNIMHPDPRKHKWMDEMMGGEGSSSLEAMHRMMGARYLECYYEGKIGGMMPGMMGGMMGPGMMMGRDMMGDPGPYRTWGRGHGMMYFGYGGVIMFIILLILIGVIIWIVISYGRKKEYIGPAKETPLEILRKRYAKGEITKDEFEKMKRDLE